jgi:hypothetical protein
MRGVSAREARSLLAAAAPARLCRRLPAPKRWPTVSAGVCEQTPRPSALTLEVDEEALRTASLIARARMSGSRSDMAPSQRPTPRCTRRVFIGTESTAPHSPITDGGGGGRTPRRGGRAPGEVRPAGRGCAGGWPADGGTARPAGPPGRPGPATTRPRSMGRDHLARSEGQHARRDAVAVQEPQAREPAGGCRRQKKSVEK